MTSGPRARAIATGAMLGDPPPGRTPWAAPLAPNEIPRTGMSPTTATFEPPPPAFLSVEEIRRGEADKSEPSPQEIARLLGVDSHNERGDVVALPAPESEEVAALRNSLSGPVEPMAPKSADLPVIDAPKPATTGSERGAELRPVEALNIAGLEPSTPSTTGRPIFEWVEPQSLLINAAYQRDMAERSTKLIRRIIAGWDWTKFKPPVCSLGENGLEIIDGQHTAIAACSHPGISQIPVMIVETETVADRAAAFIGQNVDRVGITKMQLHRAAVTAGDADAQTIEQVCERAGVRLLMAKPWRWVAGDTVAVSALSALISRRHAVGARQVLQVLVMARAAPITANGIKAVEMILFDADYGEADTDHLPEAIITLGAAAEAEAATFALSHRIPAWKALGIVWFRKCRKKRRPA